MERYLSQLTLHSLHANGHTMPNVPIICAGDIFHKWNSPPELINFALKHLPRMFAIPGQHDLPYHNAELLHRSAYWTLVEAGRIENLDPRRRTVVSPDVLVWAFPWGTPVKPLHSNARRDVLNVALVHQYVWKEGHSFPGCPIDQHVAKMLKKLKGYNVAFFGDNHKGFLHKAVAAEDCTIVNGGAFMRRRSDERDYEPCITYLYASGKVKRMPLSCSEDKINDTVEPEIIKDIDPSSLIQALSEADTGNVDFREELLRYVNDKRNGVTESVKRCIYALVEDE